MHFAYFILVNTFRLIDSKTAHWLSALNCKLELRNAFVQWCTVLPFTILCLMHYSHSLLFHL